MNSSCWSVTEYPSLRGRVLWLALAFGLVCSAGGCRDRAREEVVVQQPAEQPAVAQGNERDEGDAVRERAGNPGAAEPNAARAARTLTATDARAAGSGYEPISSLPAPAPATLPQEQRPTGYYAPVPGEPLQSVREARRQGGRLAMRDSAGLTRRSAEGEEPEFSPGDQRALEERVRQEIRQVRRADISEAELGAISVRVDESTVTLSGTVASADIAREIEDVVSRVPGVGHVDNQLEAADAPRAAE